MVTDASPCGLSAILTQKSPGKDDRRIVAYASRSLSPVECRYSQTEREALAIVWAVERLHVYLYGGPFTLYTDCRPVQLIFENAKSKPPARIERWNLHLQGYDFSVVHTRGIWNPSDFLSRHPNSSEMETHEEMAEDYVNFLTTHAVPKAMFLAEIQEATKADNTLQSLTEMISTNQWEAKEAILEGADQAELQLFRKVRGELAVSEDTDIILRRNRIVLPTLLRQRAISIAHEGHQGLVKTKKLLREKVWFPGIDKKVKQMIDQCVICQASGPGSHPEPLQMSPLPPEPWHTVNVDFGGPFPTGEYIFVVIDAYSRFPEVEIVHSTAARSTIFKMDRIFATHGIPRVVRSDNGPPFSSEEVRTYMEEKGIKHQRITPLWPQANSEAEYFMKPFKKAIRAAHAEGRDWRKHLYQFLLNYRATPHSTTGFSPSELLFNRKIKTKLPQIVLQKDSDVDLTVQQNDKRAKEQMKKYADQKSRARASDIQVGDTVLILQRKQNKWSTKFDPSPFQVVRRKGTMVTGLRNGKYVSRNVSHFKRVNTPI